MATDEADIAGELATQVPLLKKEKATAADKDLRDIVTYAGDLQGKAAAMAKRRAKIEDDRGADPADIKAYNQELVELKKAAAAVAKRCQPYRGKPGSPKSVIKIFDVTTRMVKVSDVKVKQ